MKHLASRAVMFTSENQDQVQIHGFKMLHLMHLKGYPSFICIYCTAILERVQW